MLLVCLTPNLEVHINKQVSTATLASIQYWVNMLKSLYQTVWMTFVEYILAAGVGRTFVQRMLTPTAKYPYGKAKMPPPKFGGYLYQYLINVAFYH